jgi:hypothetical protein
MNWSPEAARLGREVVLHYLRGGEAVHHDTEEAVCPPLAPRATNRIPGAMRSLMDILIVLPPPCLWRRAGVFDPTERRDCTDCGWVQHRSARVLHPSPSLSGPPGYLHLSDADLADAVDKAFPDLAAGWPA